jgi:uncharacterized protein (TIGR03437 family)
MTYRHLVALALCGGVLPRAALAQVPNASLLQIEIQNHRIYQYDVEPSKYGLTSTSLSAASFTGTAAPAFCAFTSYMAIGDIVSVNGNPVKGTVFETFTNVTASPTATPGQCQTITDITRAAIYEWNLEIMNQDGTYIGRILVQGLAGGGPPPPGAPSSITRGSYMVIGGTGAFLGVRGGYFQNTPDPSAPVPMTSVAEDPSLRRAFGGGKTHATLYLIPQSPPQVAMTASGPAVFHADFSPVTTTKPAKAGELLIVRASSLGPTRPGVDPGQPFPLDALQEVISPVGVTINGKSAEIINKIGWPGQVDTYRVDFRLPDGIAAGTAILQLTAAWIASAPLSISVQ